MPPPKKTFVNCWSRTFYTADALTHPTTASITAEQFPSCNNNNSNNYDNNYFSAVPSRRDFIVAMYIV